jgi:hypothetical protein
MIRTSVKLEQDERALQTPHGRRALPAPDQGPVEQQFAAHDRHIGLALVPPERPLADVNEPCIERGTTPWALGHF